MSAHIDTCNPFVTTNILFVTITKCFFLKKENSVIGYKRADRHYLKYPLMEIKQLGNWVIPITIFKMLSTF